MAPGVSTKVMKVLALILEAAGTTEEVGVSIPVPKTMDIEAAKKPSIVALGVVGVEEKVESIAWILLPLKVLSQGP